MFAAGAAAATLFAGCGSTTPHTEIVAENLRTDRTEQIAEQVGYIAANTSKHQAGYEFQALDADKLQHIASYTVKAAGAERPIDIVTLRYPKDMALKSARFFMDVQAAAMNFADYYKTISVPVSASGESPVRELHADLIPYTKPSVFLATPKDTFSTYVETQHNIQGLSAASFTPYVDPELEDAITIIESSHKKSKGIAVEACQSSMHVELNAALHKDGTTHEIDEPNWDHTALQEVVCNSFGILYAAVKANYSYEQYAQYVQDHHVTFGLRNGDEIHYLVFPEAAYVQVQNGEPITKAEGVVAARQ